MAKSAVTFRGIQGRVIYAKGFVLKQLSINI